MFLKVVRHQCFLVGRIPVTLLTYVHFSWTLQVDTLEGLSRKCQLRDMAGDWRSPLQCHQEYGASWGANNGLRGAWGKSCFLWCHLILLRGHQCSGGGGMIGSLQGQLQRTGAWEGGGANSLALWIPADTRSTSLLTGVPTRASSSSWSCSHSRCAAYLFSATTSLNFLNTCKERKEELVRILRKVNLGQKFEV